MLIPEPRKLAAKSFSLLILLVWVERFSLIFSWMFFFFFPSLKYFLLDSAYLLFMN